MTYFLVLAWWMIFKTMPHNMYSSAQHKNKGRSVILTLVDAAARASLLAIAFASEDIKGKGLLTSLAMLNVGVSVVLSSWRSASHYYRII
jgi:uncharacterized membrane protein